MNKLQDSPVPTGLAIIFWSLVLKVVCVIGAFAYGFYLATSQSPVAGATETPMEQRVELLSESDGAKLGFKLLRLTHLGTEVMSLVGVLMCLMLPPAVPGRFAVVISGGCQVLAAVVSWKARSAADSETFKLMAQGAAGIWLVGFFSFLQFLKSVATVSGDRGIESMAGSVAGLWVKLFVGLVVLIIFLQIMPLLGLFGLLAWVLTAFFAFVFYMALLYLLSKELSKPTDATGMPGFSFESGNMPLSTNDYLRGRS